MIIEHREYTLRNGDVDRFLELQVRRGFAIVSPVMEKLIGYFTTVDEDPISIVHLYRFDSFDDWISSLHGLYRKPELIEYFIEARATLSKQDNKFYVPAPLSALSPFWHADRDWLPSGDQPLYAYEHDVIVEEEVVDLKPGAVPKYWNVYSDFATSAVNFDDGLIGFFTSTIGRLHQVASYRYYRDAVARDSARMAAANCQQWRAIDELTSSLEVDKRIRLLKPVPIAEMSPLFSFGNVGARCRNGSALLK